MKKVHAPAKSNVYKLFTSSTDNRGLKWAQARVDDVYLFTELLLLTNLFSVL